MKKKIELVSPAGNFEKLEYAIAYGADAVYLGGKKFSLRYKADNFTLSEIKRAVEYVHSKNKKIFITVNIIPHNNEINELELYLKKLLKLDIDGIIVSDPGVVEIVKSINKNIPISLSTQANSINYKSILFWKNQGIKRIILARELSFKELKYIRKKCKSIELEIFVHGAMCVSYSGRCLLSKYLTNRNSNSGDCSHPCRWNYYLLEENRLNQPLELQEFGEKSFILNSKDLCLLKRINELSKLGIDAFKIEGRMKSIYYTAVVTGVYRKVIDAIYENQNIEIEDWFNQLRYISHRDYTEGFYDTDSEKNMMRYESSSYIRLSNFIGNVIKKISDNSFLIFIRNKIKNNNKYDIINPDMKIFENVTLNLFDKYNNPISEGNPNNELIIKVDGINIDKYSLIREKINCTTAK